MATGRPSKGPRTNMNTRMPEALVPFVLRDVVLLDSTRGEVIAHAVAHYYGHPELPPIPDATAPSETQIRMTG
jgi:hypothetical protein